MVRLLSRGRRRQLAALLALTLFAGACSSGGGDDPGGSDGATEPTVEDEGTPVRGGEVTYALEAETDDGWCLPEAQLAISGIQVARTIYDTLTAPNADGEIEPYLAESVEPNADFTEWTIKLREGITFHDGSALDAQIVKDNLDAYRGTNPARAPLLFLFVFGNIAETAVVDPLTVSVTTKTPWVAFPWYLWSSSRLGIVGRSQLEAPPEGCAKDLVGTGPFKLESWTVGSEFVAVRNESYWQDGVDGEPLPYLDKITYTPIDEVAQRVNSLETTGAGGVDLMHTSDTEQLVERLRPLQESGDINILESDRFGEVNYLMLNSSIEPFNNKNARMAVAQAIDREFLDQVRGGGIGTIANGPFAEDVMGYLEDTGYPEFDVDAAKASVAAYKEETGKDLEFTYSFAAGESGTLTSQEIQKQLQEAGIKMTPQAEGNQSSLIDKAIAGTFQAVGWRNHPGADPDTQYVWWYYGAGNPVNFGRINDPEVDRLLDEGRSTPEGRQEIYEDLNRRFGSEVYNIWTTFTIWGIGSKTNVHGILGPDLPAGGKPFPGLGTGHYVHGLWLS
ncbi:MAG: ABC transporter substrate-binding protein [Acidimicrobiales bacterium]